jgi:arabinogalactan endo-1,4-beta-galactosidase
LGSDLSYTNEMEDCGGKFRSKGIEIDPFQIMKDKGANIIRLRLWHTPSWTKYSTLADVKKSISRSKKLGMTILLDFHYSDTWADPDHQQIPKAWENIKDTQILGDSLYNNTLNTFLTLSKENLLPDMVQVGNETNSEIL